LKIKETAKNFEAYMSRTELGKKHLEKINSYVDSLWDNILAREEFIYIVYKITEKNQDQNFRGKRRKKNVKKIHN
jgi:hypothetical protein